MDYLKIKQLMIDKKQSMLAVNPFTVNEAGWESMRHLEKDDGHKFPS